MPTERIKHRKKQLTYKINFESTDTAFNENNFGILPIPSEEKSIIDLLTNADENGNRKEDKKEIHFTNIEQVNSRPNASHIITNIPGAILQFCDTEMEKDASDLFFTPDIIENIVLYTNKRIENTMAQLPNTFSIFKYIHI